MKPAQIAQRIHDQLRYGCDNVDCAGPACYTYNLKHDKVPTRRPTSTTAMAMAFALAEQPDCHYYICHGITRGPDAVPQAVEKVDPGSLEQILFMTIVSGRSRAHAAQSTEDNDQAPEMMNATPAQQAMAEPQLEEPLEAARRWYRGRSLDGQQSRAMPRHIYCGSSMSHQATFLRALCFFRMREAASEAELVFDIFTRSRQIGNAFTMIREWNSSNRLSRFFTMDVSRDNLAGETLSSLWRVSKPKLLLPFRVRIREPGEDLRGPPGAHDAGGVSQEFFHLAIGEAFGGDHGMFRPLDEDDMVWFNPWSLEPLYKFEMLGTLIGLAIHNGFVLPINLPLLVYWRLQNPRGRPEDAPIADGWPQYYKIFRDLLEDKTGQVADAYGLRYRFQFPQNGCGDGQDGPAIDMSTLASSRLCGLQEAREYDRIYGHLEAPLVTLTNTRQYVSHWLHWLISKSIGPQFDAFCHGVHNVLPPAILSTVTPEALKRLAEGEQIIDTNDLERHADYDGGYSPSSRSVRHFWTVVHDLSPEEKRALLMFVSGSSRLPASGAEGMGFVITTGRYGNGEYLPEPREGGPEDRMLCTASTCARTLTLPPWSSVEVVRRMLGVALRESVGFGLV